MQSVDHDLVIIGGGPAGLTAGQYAARARMDVVLLERAMPGGQVLITDWVENYPGFPEGITGADLVTRMTEQAQNFGLTIRSDEVTGLELSQPVKKIHLGKQSITCRTIIIASGAAPRRLKIPGESDYAGKGVSFCATCDAPFFRDQVVVAVGGGDTAVQESLYLTKFVKKVYLVHRRDQLRATGILRERVLANEKIEPVWDTILTRIEGDSTVASVSLKNVKTGDTRDISTSGVFIWIGILPNADFIGGDLATDEFGFIRVDTDMQTSVPGVFAAGDVRKTPLRQIATAVGDAAVAAHAAERYIESQF
jgi:thioredoxin reductase (NADPH)